jgi:penicillin amidase
MWAIQGDTKSVSADELAPFIAPLEFEDARLTEARDWMLDWNKRFDMDSPQAGLYAYFWRRLVANLFNDQLGDAASAGSGDQSMWAIFLLVQEPDNACGMTPAPRPSPSPATTSWMRSFQEYEQIVADHGENRENWQWGRLHTATFVSDPLGRSGIGLIERLVNRGQRGRAAALTW